MGIFRKKVEMEEQHFQETINLLKGLSRVKAPDNFEYKLMVKIENEDFSIQSEELKRSRFTWVLPPAAAVALTAIVLIFVLTDQAIETDNPLISLPTLRTEYQSASEDKKEGPVEYIARETTESRGSSEEREIFGGAARSSVGSGAVEENFKVVLQPNDVVVKEKVGFPFNNSNNVNLDNFIEGSAEARGSNSSARLVREGTPVFDFNGFFIREKVDRKTLEKNKSRIDSLKRIERRNERDD